VPPPLTGWWSRVGASLLDALIAFGILLVPLGGALVLIVLKVEDEDTAGNLAELVTLLAVLIFELLYFPLTMRRAGANNGQTWGKQVVGIRVLHQDGQPFTAGSAIVREILVKNILMGLCTIVQIVNLLWPLWDDINQALHDKVVHTVVVRA
jgi:uncharacterized RDD family membrane protein YckC